MKPPKSVEVCSPTTRAWQSNPGVVYFVAAGEPTVAIKIGMAALTGGRDLRATLIRRLSQIQSSNHELICLLGVIPFTEGAYPTRDAEAKERELHIEFDHLRRFEAYKRGSEWFNPSPELQARIEQLVVKPQTLQLREIYSATLA